jgi:hypothetical protein
MNKWMCCAVFVFCSSGLNIAIADDDSRLGEKLFTAELVRVEELTGGPAGPAGTDPLDRGRIDVRRKRQVEAAVFGAAQTATYGVVFCRATVVSQPLCVTLGDLITDAKGYGTARFPFPTAGESWTGAFVLTRNGANQFVSGFRFPPLEESQPGVVEVEFKGPIGSLNPANQSLRLAGLAVDVFVTASTKLEGIEGFAGLQTGEAVKIRAIVRPDGTIQAVSIEAEDAGDGNGNSDKKDKDE